MGWPQSPCLAQPVLCHVTYFWASAPAPYGHDWKVHHGSRITLLVHLLYLCAQRSPGAPAAAEQFQHHLDKGIAEDVLLTMLLWLRATQLCWPDPQPGLRWVCCVDSPPKPPLAHCREQTCPVHSVLALADGNNTESSFMATSQELYHSILFNRKCMYVFICLLTSKLLELLTSFVSFLLNFKN